MNQPNPNLPPTPGSDLLVHVDRARLGILRIAAGEFRRVLVQRRSREADAAFTVRVADALAAFVPDRVLLSAGRISDDIVSEVVAAVERSGIPMVVISDVRAMARTLRLRHRGQDGVPSPRPRLPPPPAAPTTVPDAVPARASFNPSQYVPALTPTLA